MPAVIDQGDRVLRTRGVRVAIALLLFVLAFGTVGYMTIEGWNLLDALYMTLTTVTTVGFREVRPLSRTGQVFTLVLVAGGVGTVLYCFTLFAALVVEGDLQRSFERRRRNRMINALKDHFILCGAGRIGALIASEFRRQKIPFVVVDRDAELVQSILERGDLAVEADATQEGVLQRVGLERARGLIAAVGTDAENLYTVLTARVLRPDLFIIARAESEDAGRKMLRAGATRVISPYQIGALQMAQAAIRPAVVDFVELATSSENLELAMEQIRIGAGAELAGRSIIEANLRQRFGVIVVGIRHEDGHMDFNPPPDAVMNVGDELIVLGRPETLKDLEAAAR